MLSFKEFINESKGFLVHVKIPTDKKVEKFWYQDKADAEKWAKSVKSKGGTAKIVKENYDRTEKQIANLEKRIQGMNDNNDSSGEKRKKANQQLRKLQDKIRDM